MKSFNDYIHNIREEPPAQIIKGRCDIQKSDDEKRQIFGWASVAVTEDGEQVEDWQGDMIDPEDLEQAAYEYMLLFGNGGEMHDNPTHIVSKVIESIVFTEDKLKAMGIPEGTLPLGWWIGFQIQDDDVWEKIKNGTYSMFSIEGTAERVEVDDDDINDQEDGE